MKNINKYKFRYQLFLLLDKGMYTAIDVAWELNVSIRQVRRLLSKFRLNKKKISVFVPKARLSAWNKINSDIVDEIVTLKKERLGRSNKFITECIENKFLRKISSSTVKRILVSHGCYEKIKREKRVFQNMEEKITHSGQMIQFDVCEGAWLAGYRRVYLIAFIDAYSRYIVGWKWVNTNSSWNNILVLRSVALKYGVPEMFYTDNASFYKVIRHNQSIHQKHKSIDEYETTMQRIIIDLGSVMVNHKPYQPQGKGRIERFFRFMQDRFIAEHTATSLEELNQQFEVWVKWYNTKHIIRTIDCKPKDRLNPKGFKPVPKNLNIEKVFSYQFSRKVDKYNSFSFESANYVIDPQNCKHFGGCLTNCTIYLFVGLETITVYHQDIRIQEFKRAKK